MSGFLGLIIAGGATGGSTPVTPSVYIAMSGSTPAKRLSVYQWDSVSGFGSSFSTPTISTQLQQVGFSSDNSIFSCCYLASPYFSVWKWSSLGFGTQYSNPGTLLSPSSSGPSNYAFTKNLDALITTNNGGPSYPQAWAWSNLSGFGSKYSNGSAMTSTSAAYGCALNASNSQVAFSHYAVPSVSMFPWSSSTGFGTKYSNPVTLPVGNSFYGCTTFNQITNDLAIGLNTNPFVAAYAVTASGFGAKYSNPSSFIGGTVYATKFAPDGAAIAIGSNITPTALKVYSWGAGFGSIYSSPSITVTVQAADWSSTTNAVAAGVSGASPYVYVYPWSSSGFGAKYSNPSTLPGTSYAISFSNQ